MFDAFWEKSKEFLEENVGTAVNDSIALTTSFRDRF